MKKPSPTRRRRDETTKFRLAIMRLRRELGWTQNDLAALLAISKRTLSNWECGYWLPPYKQRLHIVLSLRTAPPEYVLEVADALGVSVNPATVPFLQPYRDAVYPPPEPVVPVVAAVSAPPPRAPLDPAHLRKAVDAVVHEVADGMNVAANELRAGIGRALATCAELGATLDEMRDAVAVRTKRANGQTETETRGE
jgi:transcriptional regulator with XRE-family HTH domain